MSACGVPTSSPNIWYISIGSPILHRFQVWLIICQVFASDRRALHFNALAGDDPCEYRYKWYTAEN